MRKVDVAIIGAGSAGLSARREVAQVTDNYVVIDDGPTGTTCARVGCMPSKVLIEAANIYASRKKYKYIGVSGEENLTINLSETMTHVRKLRDRFVRAVNSDMESWVKDHLIQKRAKFESLHVLDLGDEKIEAKTIIIATGSRPIVPKDWTKFGSKIITSDQIFELETLPKRIAVIGLGVIGLELGQALSRLGVEVFGLGKGEALAGLSDPEIQKYALSKFQLEFPIWTGGVDSINEGAGPGLSIKSGKETIENIDLVLVTVGRTPNINGLGIEQFVDCDRHGIPIFDKGTYRIGKTSVFLVGDVNNDRPILHEASDEGRIAGYNALREKEQCFARRTKLVITFSDPNIAMVGRTFTELLADKTDFVTGKVSYEGQGRAIAKLTEKGLVHVYADKISGHLLGAELFAPEAEHLAHLLAWAIAAKMTVTQTLALPFYHPVLEEGLRTALRAAASQIESSRSKLEVLRCQDPPVGIFAKKTD